MWAKIGKKNIITLICHGQTMIDRQHYSFSLLLILVNVKQQGSISLHTAERGMQTPLGKENKVEN